MQLGVMDFCQSKCILHANKTFRSGFDVTATVVARVYNRREGEYPTPL